MLILFIFIRQMIIYYCSFYINGESLSDNVFSGNRLGTAVMIFLILCGIFGTAELFMQQVQALKKEKTLIKEKLESELGFLKAQMNPHFLFNTLNNIYGLARKNSPKTPETILQLSRLLRFTLYDSKHKGITIDREIKIIENYISLEQIRYSDNLSLIFKKVIDNEEQEITPLILLPFVENAFKHGASESINNPSIDICLQLDKGILKFNIKNSKEKKENSYKANIGLINVKRQLELIYPVHNLIITNNLAAFEIELTINLNNYANL